MTLHYDFPENITLEEVKTIVENNPNFILADKGNYSVSNYVRAGNDVHVPVTDRQSAILRELRGLIFSNYPGRVISRRFQKFFNYGEREDVMTLDLSHPHVMELVLDEKVDDLYPLLSENDSNKLRSYYKDVWDQIVDFTELTQKLINNTSHMNRKEFAFHTANIGTGMRSIAFSCFDKKRVDIGKVVDYLRKNLGSNSRFQRNREIVATKWNYKNTSE